MCGSLAAVARDVVDQLTCGAGGNVEPRPAAAESAWWEVHGTLRPLTKYAHRTASRDLRLRPGRITVAVLATSSNGRVPRMS